MLQDGAAKDNQIRSLNLTESFRKMLGDKFISQAVSIFHRLYLFTESVFNASVHENIGIN